MRRGWAVMPGDGIQYLNRAEGSRSWHAGRAGRQLSRFLDDRHAATLRRGRDAARVLVEMRYTLVLAAR
jgi:hypothetical protein